MASHQLVYKDMDRAGYMYFQCPTCGRTVRVMQRYDERGKLHKQIQELRPGEDMIEHVFDWFGTPIIEVSTARKERDDAYLEVFSEHFAGRNLRKELLGEQ